MISQKKRSKLVRLHNNPVKEYAWGSADKKCYVARFHDHQRQFSSYAELWMGIHPHGQSSVIVSENNTQKQLKLSSYLSTINQPNPTYLTKFLSIKKCLSIQTHPSLNQALLLNKKDPQTYSDANDKPQMFYTLSQFQCFLGYISEEELKRILMLDIFNKYIDVSGVKNARDIIIGILGLGEEKQRELLGVCMGKLEEIHPGRYGVGMEGKKIRNILVDFSNDIGIVVSFFLEYMVLQPGVCFYIECNTPHAYIHGQCIQIMKNSDNVCRLGLTPKFKDIQIINDILGSNFNKIPQITPITQTKDPYKQYLYSSNKLNFLIIKYVSNPYSHQCVGYKISQLKYIRILIILKGILQIRQSYMKQYQICQQGNIILVHPNVKYEVKNVDDQECVICLNWAQF